ncbi:GNAT family N-acetyltransferase [Bacillus sp. Au-Bac7]|uniref:GNAT family N-acetyltransferase n=1 Tax=Bacillus sp. Au-Bac7 TaxID=2906458 RepID=UPI001E4AE79E|nr:GNAT family N-acetyltransferase [Bacillus sp. Au-Bac7]MCE4049640.1 GNAT family N-acetyltransferase [Bacillus sp. Au-Bac7]
MKVNIAVNLPIENHEVPDLREAVGWGRRDKDYPSLLERCNFWAGGRDEFGKLVAFGYVCGMGLEHGYVEDIIVHPSKQKQGIGMELVTALIAEARQFGLGILTVSFDEHNANFYKTSGFTVSSGGVLYLD